MGADLYINSLVEKARKQYDHLFQAAVTKRNDLHKMGYINLAEEAQKEVSKYYELSNGEGYFRDSYNNSSLFWMLGLSWWEMSEEGLVDGRGYISPENAYLLAELVKNSPYVKPITADTFSDTESVEEVQEYFDNKKKEFIKFLMLAVKLNESIRASV